MYKRLEKNITKLVFSYIKSNKSKSKFLNVNIFTEQMRWKR